MPVTPSQVRDLRTAAKESHRVGLHRLARLLDKVGDLGQMLRDGSDLDANLTVPDVVEIGATVARDLLRDVERGCAADLLDEDAVA